MTTNGILLFLAFAALVCASEVDDIDQKKRGAGKQNALNAIPTGAQKPEYTYNIYTQNPNVQSSQHSQTYQSQVPNSFYPSQGTNQYYTSSNSGQEATSTYPQQPQVHLAPPPSSSQFVPLNFIPNSGYQSKYQIIPSKTSNGNIQLAILPQPSTFPTPPLLSYPQLFSPAAHQMSLPQASTLNLLPPQGHFNIAPNYQPLSFGGSHLGQGSMLLLAQPSASLYNNLLYPSPVPNYYNYNPSNSQAKYSLSYGASPTVTGEYEKGLITQSISKEDNDISAQNSEYIAQSASNASYKTAYSSSPSYTKLQ